MIEQSSHPSTPGAAVARCAECGAPLDAADDICPFCGRITSVSRAARDRTFRVERELRGAARDRARAARIAGASRERARTAWRRLAGVALAIASLAIVASWAVAVHGLTAGVFVGSTFASLLAIGAEIIDARATRRDEDARGIVPAEPGAVPIGECPACGAPACLWGDGSFCGHCDAPLLPDAGAEWIASGEAAHAHVALEHARFEERLRVGPCPSHALALVGTSVIVLVCTALLILTVLSKF